MFCSVSRSEVYGKGVGYVRCSLIDEDFYYLIGMVGTIEV